ncbi:DUF1353 domain-containing protein [Roseibium sp.]|uniref:DUF1353 domain-containing protein n=1 Tax=Roseibium sp. TaxID=1936156 RepID=UPI003B509AFB
MNSPKILPDHDKFRNWYLDEDITIKLHNGDTIEIKKGYRFNGHSVPWPLSLIIPRYDTDIVAALVHDYLLDTGPWHRYNRAFMDKEYELQMQEHSYGYRKWLMPAAVRLFGTLRFGIWGDNRGNPKPNTNICVVVTSDE